MKINCENCDKEIERTPFQIKRAKHTTCSRKCQGELLSKLSKITIKCKQCDKTLEKRKGDEKIFCSQSCAASFNNSNKERKEKNTSHCKWCDTELSNGVSFCDNNRCFHEHKHAKRVESYLNEEYKGLGKQFFKRFVTERDGYKCNCCGLSDWNNKPIVLELEHIDGHAENNHPTNLCLLCPNCHSQTPTFKGANRGNGRKDRRDIYRKGVKAE